MPPVATQSNLTKLEMLLGAMGYSLRYEKGNFRSAACMVKDKKLVLINKFATLDSKIAALMEIIMILNPDENIFESKEKAFYLSMKQTTLFS